jgi:hypothetical protein
MEMAGRPTLRCAARQAAAAPPCPVLPIRPPPLSFLRALARGEGGFGRAQREEARGRPDETTEQAGVFLGLGP